MAVPSTTRAKRLQPQVICIVLVAITVAVFAQNLRYGFIDYDDNEYVYDNPMVTKGLTFRGVLWAFTHFDSHNWHPLTWLSHMLDCQMYGMYAGGHHLTNLLLHTITVVAFFLLLRKMTGALWRSAFVSAVFAIHPLRVESVAWISERKDILSGLFFLLTIAAYVAYARQSPSPKRYALVMLLFALGLMCKPMLVTLPIILLLLDYWPLQRTEPPWKLVLEKCPLLALSAASCVVTLIAQKGAIQSTRLISLPLRLGNALVSCAIYLGQMFYPVRLAAFYPYPSHLPILTVICSGILVIAISVIAWMARRQQPWLLVGWLWYLTMLAPVVGIIQVGLQAHADRYTYLPQIGICIAITWLVAQWHPGKRLIGCIAAVLLILLAGDSGEQIDYWRNSETLWTHTLAVTKDNDVAHNNLGTTFLKEGKVADAIVQFQDVVNLTPRDADARYSLGTALLQGGRIDDAILQLQTAVQINPNDADAYYNLAMAFEREGKADDAITQFQSVLKIDPTNAAAEYNLAVALRQHGDVDAAIAHYQKALQLDPTNADAENNLANALLSQGKMDEAIEHFQSALQINPAYTQARNNLGNALLRNGNMPEAVTQFQKALQTDPANAAYKNNLAWILATWPRMSLRNGEQAVELAKEADQLTGGKDPSVLRTLAAAYAQAGRFPEAVEAAQRALLLVEAQSNKKLAKALQSEIKFYQSGKPYPAPVRGQ